MVIRILIVAIWSCAVEAQQDVSAITPQGHNYLLGPGDQIAIWAVDLDELSQKSFRIDASGMVTLPLTGRVRAAGLTIAEFEQQVVRQLKAYQHNPQVSVNVTEYRSQPISVLGAVNSPGVHHLQGPITLIEALSAAGGLRQDAGHTIMVTRLRGAGTIPLAGAREDATGQYSITEINAAELTNASSPEKNITIVSQDIISVTRAEMVYVMGEVARPGAYTLGEHREMSVLEAISLAGGVTRTASKKNSKILRLDRDVKTRTEQPLNLQSVLEGRSNDVVLRADDVLFVPDNKPRSVAIRAVEAALSAGTGIVVWRTAR